jgi:hypothetical protein
MVNIFRRKVVKGTGFSKDELNEILSVGIFFYRNVVWRLFANMFLCHCNVAGMI